MKKPNKTDCVVLHYVAKECTWKVSFYKKDGSLIESVNQPSYSVAIHNLASELKMSRKNQYYPDQSKRTWINHAECWR